MDCLSIYLEVADSAKLPHDWSKYADFSLAVVNQIDHQLTVKRETSHLFNTHESGWGFPSFISLRNVHALTKGYLVDDTLIVEAEVSAQRVIDSQADDLRKQTGQRGAGSPSQITEDVGTTLEENDYFDIYIQASDHEGDPQKRPKKHKGGDGGGEGNAHNVQQRGVLPKDPRGTLGKTMTEAQITIVLRDITRGLIPTNLEDLKWPSSAGEMAPTFYPVVKLVDEFRAMKVELERLRTRVMTLSDAMKYCVEKV